MLWNVVGIRTVATCMDSGAKLEEHENPPKPIAKLGIAVGVDSNRDSDCKYPPIAFLFAPGQSD